LIINIIKGIILAEWSFRCVYRISYRRFHIIDIILLKLLLILSLILIIEISKYFWLRLLPFCLISFKNFFIIVAEIKFKTFFLIIRSNLIWFNITILFRVQFCRLISYHLMSFFSTFSSWSLLILFTFLNISVAVLIQF